MIQKPCVLITGGAGFIGSHIADRFHANGYRVVVVDNLTTGKPDHLPADVCLYEADIQDRPAMEEIFDREKPDYLVHEAAQISVSRSVREPETDAGINVLGFIHVLECAVRHKVQKVVFASSGGVLYGEVEEPAKEDHPLRPASPYGVTKLAGEWYLHYYAKQYGLPYVALRYANVYGPRQDPNGEAGVVAIFAQALLRGEAPTIFGDGSCIRDYVYVEDVARANLLALERNVSNRAFNIGTGVATDVNRLFQMIAELSGSSIEPLYGPPRPGDLQRSVLDCEQAARELGWRPQVQLAEGLQRTIDWFRKFS